MTHKFQRHYTRDEARALLPQVKEWLGELRSLRDELADLDGRMAHLLAAGDDLGGDLVNNWVKKVTHTRKVLMQFARHDIQIKDIERGLIDFPAIIGGREVFLCWEQDEDDIEFWHDLDTGFAGRERL